jgi:hypothetical protein
MDSFLAAVPPQPPAVPFEYLDCHELASRLTVPETWVREHVRHGCLDPIPHVRFGKYIRFRWGSPELTVWLERRIVGGNNKAGRRAQRKDTVQ